MTETRLHLIKSTQTDPKNTSRLALKMVFLCNSVYGQEAIYKDCVPKRGSSREREMGKREKKGRMCRSQKNGPPSAQDISENIMKVVHCGLSIRLHKSNNESSK